MTSRVWDSFLTERDKAHLAASTHRKMGFGEKPVLLLIDLYRWVFGDEPQPLLESIKDWPGSCGMAAWDSIPHIQTLLQSARDNEDSRGPCDGAGPCRNRGLDSAPPTGEPTPTVSRGG